MTRTAGASIAEWLGSLGLSEYAHGFAENRIDWAILPALSDQDLKDLGVAALGDRRKLTLAIAALGCAESTAQASKTPAPAARPEPVGLPGGTDGSHEASRQSRGPERRQLTVMFCDLVGSTALTARLDPEDVREVVRAYQGACAEVIGRYEGFVAQYLGDGIMAYFGYPQAHEDDAERAVRAGLDLIAAVAKLNLKTKIEVRIGIATGLVVVGDLIGEQGAKERAVTGETPNLAARLQGLASPGSIVVSAATRRLLGGMFAFRDLGDQSIKGLDAPVPAWAVVGARSFESRFEARAGGLTGFVGREDECAHLLERKKLAWQGRGQLVLLSGEAGIGKSRLSAWLVDQIAAEPHLRLRFQCTPHHRDSALHPAIAQLERAAGLAPDDTQAVKLDKIEAILALAGLDTKAIAPLFAALLSIPAADRYPPLGISAAQQRQRTMAAMLDQIGGLARQKPVLMIYEDAHWADATSLEHLEMVADHIAKLPVLAIVTGRPEFVPAWAGRHNVSTLALFRLDKRQARSLVDGVTGGAELPPEVLDQIVAKTDGVPLFVEELTKTVLESGLLVEEGSSYRLAGPLPSFAIPATLQDSLMARLDRSNPVKEIAQIGAAIGREFSYKLLLAVAGMDEPAVRTGLAKLEDSELATRRGVPPDATYTFKHALVQDAAYESLLKSRRQTLHRRIAKTLRDRFPVLAETEPELIAHHFSRAGRLQDAVDWWTKAGELAVRRSAIVEAISHFERAVTIADGLAADPSRATARFRLQIAYGNALITAQGYSDEKTIGAFNHCARLGTEINDLVERLTGFYGTWAANLVAGPGSKSLEMAETFLGDLGRLSEGTESAISCRILGTSRWCVGDYVGAVQSLETALANYDARRDFPLAFRLGLDVGVSTMTTLAHALWPLGKVDQARDMAEQAILHARTCAHPNSLATALAYSSYHHVILGDAGKTLAQAEEVRALARENDMAMWLHVGLFLSGWARWRSGDRTIGAEMMREGRGFFGDRRHGAWEPLFSMQQAEALAKEQPDAELSILQDLLAFTSSAGQRWLDAEIHRRCGEILVGHFPARTETAEAAFGQALAVSRAQHTRSFELRASLDLARLYCDTGRERKAGKLLTGALVGFTETPELPEIASAKQLLATLVD